MAENDSYRGGAFEGVERHASALGWVVLEWCRLYEELGLLFVELVNPDNRQALLAAWHAVKSDRTQRFMLRAVAENSLCGRRAPLRRRILWAIGQLDSMENKRNDAVHAPVAIGLDEDMVRVAVFPMLTTGNPRAKTLVGNDLEQHFRIYQRNTAALRHFLESLRPFLRPDAPLDLLPKRPQPEGTTRSTAQPQENNAPQPPKPPDTRSD